MSESSGQESKIEPKESEIKNVNYVDKSVKLGSQELKSVKSMNSSSHLCHEVKKVVEQHEIGDVDGLSDVSHLKYVNSSVNFDLNVLVDTSLLSYKRLALGNGKKPSIAVCKIKKMGQAENKLYDEISKLCVCQNLAQNAAKMVHVNCVNLKLSV